MTSLDATDVRSEAVPAELRGYSLPLSPTGQASMLTAPPWHFSGEVILVDYRADPRAARRFLPPQLSLGAEPGAAAAVFASWQWCSDTNAEVTDPALNQFNEFLILLACEFEGQPMARCPFAWVDQPIPLLRGWVQGMPKQFGEVHQSRSGTLGRAAPRLAPGGRFAGSLSVRGRRVVEAGVTLASVADQPPALHTVPLVHSLTFPAWVGDSARKPDLVASEVTDVEFSQVWQGDGQLSFPATTGSDLAEFASLAPVEVGDGYVFSYSETLRGGRLLARGENEQLPAPQPGVGKH
jgi:enduracididine biosynthesis enzyme MppR